MLNAALKHKEDSLAGKCFVSTRPVGKSEELKECLGKYGAELLELPMIELSEVNCNEKACEVLANYDKYTHVAFTSAFGFEFFLKKIRKHNHFEDIISKVKIASLGYKTSEVITNAGLPIAFDAMAKTGEEFALKFAEYLKGKDANVIWVTNELAPNHLVNKVGELAQITRLDLYKNSLPKNIDKALLKRLSNDDYEMIVVASPSAFKNLYSITQDKAMRIVCIGQTTALEAQNYGVVPLAVANEPNAQGLTNAVLDYYHTKDNPLTK